MKIYDDDLHFTWRPDRTPPEETYHGRVWWTWARAMLGRARHSQIAMGRTYEQFEGDMVFSSRRVVRR